MKNLSGKRGQKISTNPLTTEAVDGRGMTVDGIRRSCLGRVWTGVQAKERGLVDILGNFNDAVSIATVKAGVSNDYKLKYYPFKSRLFKNGIMEIEENTRHPDSSKMN
ncbi:MAG: S49 family peptidase [Cytophagales bacterium]|nr:S49 family peptidase [Cytophagales bacterium]